MVTDKATKLTLLKDWTPTVFFLASIMVTIVYFIVISGVSGSPMEYALLVILLTLILIGLAGLYPWFKDENRSLARLALLATGVAILALLAAIAFRTGAVISSTPMQDVDYPWKDAMWDIQVFGPAIGFLLYGAVSLRSADKTRLLGLNLVLVALSYPAFLGFGNLSVPYPWWVFPIGWWVLLMSFMGLGAGLRSAKPPADRIEYYQDTSEDEALEEDGWINGFVRPGFGVDGSISRKSPLDMESRLKTNQILYEGTDGVMLTFYTGIYRLTYPILRTIGGLLGREAGVEQFIAENEYLLGQLGDHERAGLTSIQGWLGLIAVLLFGAIGMASVWLVLSAW